MTRDTSTEVYHQIESEGLLSKMRLEVYSALFSRGPTTSGELAQHVQNTSRNNVATRMTELRKRGVVREMGERPCKVTGRNVIVWDVTSDLPRPIDKKSTPPRLTDEQKEEALADLRVIAKHYVATTIEPCPESIIKLGKWLAG